MSSAWDELGGKAESYAEALARCDCLKPKGMTEQEQAERLVAGRERMKHHDLYWHDQFISPTEQQVISRKLARQLGYTTESDFNETDD